jgi:hypothetical protein
MYIFADLRKFKIRKSHKRLGPQIANAFLTPTEGPQIIQVRKFSDLRFAELICGHRRRAVLFQPSLFLLSRPPFK